MKIVSIIARYMLGLMFSVFRHEQVSELGPPATASESTSVAVLCRCQLVAFCRVLLRGAGASAGCCCSRDSLCPCAHAACGGALQHPRIRPDVGVGHRSGIGGVGAVVAGLPPVPQELQGCSGPKACAAMIVSPCRIAFRQCAQCLEAAKRADAGNGWRAGGVRRGAQVGGCAFRRTAGATSTR